MVTRFAALALIVDCDWHAAALPGVLVLEATVAACRSRSAWEVRLAGRRRGAPHGL
jgi:hypothetical protein